MIESNEQRIVDEAITSRHSMRAFLPTPVAREDIERLLEVASRAPSGSNIQPWKVHIAEYRYYPDTWISPFIDRRRKVGLDLYRLLGLGRDDKAGMQAQHARNYHYFDAPVGMVITMSRSMNQGSWFDVGCFVQNLMVAARARGLDTCAQAAFNHFHTIVREITGIPQDEVMVCSMSLGFADPSRIENSLVSEREPVSAFTTFIE